MKPAATPPLRVHNIVTGLLTSKTGVCDPWGKAECNNSWIDCDLQDFKCAALQDPEIWNITLRFPRTAVPNTETNYMCMTFDLPDDDVYHLVATQPFIDNVQVMHHMLLHPCQNGEATPLTDTPSKCGMEAGNGGCGGIIGGWTVGSPGNCEHEDAGYVFGRGVFKRVVLEFHWNNPELRDDYFDASGMTIFYTPRLRPNNATTFVVGQMELEIPPRQLTVQQIGSCPGDCSRMIMKQPLFVVSATNHMHYMGRSQKVELIRNGQFVAYISNDEVFSYDSPVRVLHDPPIQILPGDEIRTTCVYTSQYKDKTVYYGDGTSDEMCYAFLSVYPEEALPFFKQCVAFGEQSLCEKYAGGSGEDNGDGNGGAGGDGDGGAGGAGPDGRPRPGPGQGGDGTGDGHGDGDLPAIINGCDWAEFANVNSQAFLDRFDRLYASCTAFGSCRLECAKLLEEDRFRRDPCLRDPGAWRVVQRQLMASHEGLLTAAYFDSCHLSLCPICQKCRPQF